MLKPCAIMFRNQPQREWLRSDREVIKSSWNGCPTTEEPLGVIHPGLSSTFAVGSTKIQSETSSTDPYLRLGIPFAPKFLFFQTYYPIFSSLYHIIWVNYSISLTWIKAIWGWFPLLTMIPVRENSEVVIIYPDGMEGYLEDHPVFFCGE